MANEHLMESDSDDDNIRIRDDNEDRSSNAGDKSSKMIMASQEMDDDAKIPTEGIIPSSSSGGTGPDDVRPSTGTPWHSAPGDLRPNVTLVVNDYKDIDLGSVALPESDNVEYYEVYIQGADDDSPIPFNPINPLSGIPQVDILG